ncbi:smr domain containing protein [Grosmannia clavigera kw1407]|uniref:Smr domain containing protein n=1 Tax=Grosmannia clavigera (strain kw1407 / UAMH 11150) TaxID=655863 RepID=F0X9U7_GROCL|nr:smr domain containing protein [Grosmannia clavigera kw1407]EFX05443.1 smr domain containing protein [Grosmannia clavigera kw1407]
MGSASAPRGDEEDLDKLITEFGSLVDESLVVLIFREQGYQETRKALAEISKDVRDEEASGFDTGNYYGSEGGSNIEGAQSPSLTNSGSWATSDYDIGSPRTAASAMADDFQPLARDQLLPDTADAGATPEATLKSIFPMLKDTDIRRALKESAGDAMRASDILLNIKHLEETGQRLKGIDAFFQLDGFPAKKSRKKAHTKEKETGRQRLSVDYKLAPLSVNEQAECAERSSTQSAPPQVSMTPGNCVDQAAMAEKSWAAAGASYAAASAATRRGRSDPLFRQVAAVYSDRGREQAAVARLRQSAAADAFVEEQSSADVIDVHYVTVDDGVRIAVERTQQWWVKLGEHRIKKARNEPLRVVTGSGVHSAKGFSRMYGEVGAALERAGWKVQPGIGHYLVTGKK